MSKVEIKLTEDNEIIKVSTNGVCSGSDLMTLLCVGAASVIHETAVGSGVEPKALTACFIRALFESIDDIVENGYDCECLDVQVQ